MDLISILFNCVYVFVVLCFSFKRPTLFICTYILFYTKYLGFFSNEVLIAGSDIGSFFLNMSLFIPICFGNGFSRENDAISRVSIAFISFFILYGIFKPVLDGNQNLIMGIMAGKSFFTYTFFIYLILYRKHLDFDLIFNCFLLISFYFSFLYILNAIGIRIVPPYYEKNNFIQCQYDSFLPYSIIILFYYRYVGKVISLFYLKILILLIAIYVGGFFSIMSTSILAIFVLLFSRRIYGVVEYIFLFLVLAFYISIAYLAMEQTDWYLELYRHQSNALLSRDNYNEFRWTIIEQSQWLGSGFLYKTSGIVRTFASSGYRETFSFIDAGYIDLLGRFGWVGMIVFLIYPIVIFIRSLGSKNLFPFSVFIIQLLLINYTWAVFTFQMGILVLSVTYVFIINCLYPQRR